MARDTRNEERRYALASIDSNVGVRANDGSDGHRRTEVRKRLDRLPAPRGGGPQSPDEIRDEEYDGRLVETVQHVQPELQPRVLEPADTPNVELGESERGLSVEILVERCTGGRAR